MEFEFIKSRIVASHRSVIQGIGFTLAMGLASAAVVAQPSVLVEACKSLKDGKKRAECLKTLEATAQPAAAKPAEIPKTPPPLAALTIESAAKICVDDLMQGLASRLAEATEDQEMSTPDALFVTWTGAEGKPRLLCGVDRNKRKIVSVGLPPTAMTGAALEARIADVALRKQESKEIEAGNYAPFVTRIKAQLTRQFKDPGSAQFRNVFISGKSLKVLCGEVNAKNSYGAYNGFNRFYSTGDPMLSKIGSSSSSSSASTDNYLLEKMWPTMCGDKIADIPD